MTHTQFRTLLFGAIGLCGCKSEGGAYVFLRDLCDAYAEDICAAREDCACEDVSPNCNREVAQACSAIRSALEERDGLTYDADMATDVRAALVQSLSRCEDPLRVNRFFSGALADGESCDEDLACASGLCETAEDEDTGTCQDAPAFPLCEAPAE